MSAIQRFFFRRKTVGDTLAGRRFLRRTRGLETWERVEPSALMLASGFLTALALLAAIAVIWNEITGMFDPPIYERVVDRRILDDVEATPGCFIDLAVDPQTNDALALRSADANCLPGARGSLVHRLHDGSRIWSTPEQPFGDARTVRPEDAVAAELERPCAEALDEPCLDTELVFARSANGGLSRWRDGAWKDWLSADAFIDRARNPVGDEDVAAAAVDPERRRLVLVTASGAVGLVDGESARWRLGALDGADSIKVVDAAWSSDAIWIATERSLLVARDEGSGPLQFERVATEEFLDLTRSRDGVVALSRVPCAEDTSSRCSRVAQWRLESSGAAAKLWLDESGKDPELEVKDVKFTAELGGWIVLAGERGVQAYQPESRHWRRLVSETRQVTAMAAEPGSKRLVFGGPGWAGEATLADFGDREDTREIRVWPFAPENDAVRSITLGSMGAAVSTEGGRLFVLGADGVQQAYEPPEVALSGAPRRIFAEGDTVTFVTGDRAVVHDLTRRSYLNFSLKGPAQLIASVMDGWALSSGVVYATAKDSRKRFQFVAFPINRPDAAKIVAAGDDVVSISAEARGGALAILSSGAVFRLTLSTKELSATEIMNPRGPARAPTDVAAAEEGLHLAGPDGLWRYDVDARAFQQTRTRPLRAIDIAPDGSIYAVDPEARLLRRAAGVAPVAGASAEGGFEPLTGGGLSVTASGLVDAIAVEDELRLLGRAGANVSLDVYDASARRVVRRTAVSAPAAQSEIVGAVGAVTLVRLGGALFADERRLSPKNVEVESAWIDDGRIWTVERQSGERYVRSANLGGAISTGSLDADAVCWWRRSRAVTGGRRIHDTLAVGGDLTAVLTDRGLNFYDAGVRKWLGAEMGEEAQNARIARVGEALFVVRRGAKATEVVRYDLSKLARDRLSCAPEERAAPKESVTLHEQGSAMALDPQAGALAWLSEDGAAYRADTRGNKRQIAWPTSSAPTTSEIMRVTAIGEGAVFFFGRKAAYVYERASRRWARTPHADAGPIDDVVLTSREDGVVVTARRGASWEQVIYDVAPGPQVKRRSARLLSPPELQRSPREAFHKGAPTLVDGFAFGELWGFLWEDRLAFFDPRSARWTGAGARFDRATGARRVLSYLPDSHGLLDAEAGELTLFDARAVESAGFLTTRYDLSDAVRAAVLRERRVLRLVPTGAVEICEPAAAGQTRCGGIEGRAPADRLADSDVVSAVALQDGAFLAVLRNPGRLALIQSDRIVSERPLPPSGVAQSALKDGAAVLRAGADAYTRVTGQAKIEVQKDVAAQLTTDAAGRLWAIAPSGRARIWTDGRFSDPDGAEFGEGAAFYSIESGLSVLENGFVLGPGGRRAASVDGHPENVVAALPPEIAPSELAAVGFSDNRLWLQIGGALRFYSAADCYAAAALDDAARDALTSNDPAVEEALPVCEVETEIDLEDEERVVAAVEVLATDVNRGVIEARIVFRGGTSERVEEGALWGWSWGRPELSGPDAGVLGDRTRLVARIGAAPNGESALNPIVALEISNGRVWFRRIADIQDSGLQGRLVEDGRPVPSLAAPGLAWDREGRAFRIADLKGGSRKIEAAELLAQGGSPIFLGFDQLASPVGAGQIFAANDYGLWRFARADGGVAGGLAFEPWPRGSSREWRVADRDRMIYAEGRALRFDGESDEPVSLRRIAFGDATILETSFAPGVRFEAPSGVERLLTEEGFAWDRLRDLGFRNGELFARSDYGVHRLGVLGERVSESGVVWSEEGVAAARAEAPDVAPVFAGRSLTDESGPVAFDDDLLIAAAVHGGRLFASTPVGVASFPSSRAGERAAAANVAAPAQAFLLERGVNRLWARFAEGDSTFEESSGRFKRAASPESAFETRRLAEIGPLRIERRRGAVAVEIDAFDPVAGQSWSKALSWNGEAFPFDLLDDVVVAVSADLVVARTQAGVLTAPLGSRATLRSARLYAARDRSASGRSTLHRESNGPVRAWWGAGGRSACITFTATEPEGCGVGSAGPLASGRAGVVSFAQALDGSIAFLLHSASGAPVPIHYNAKARRFEHDALTSRLQCGETALWRTEAGGVLFQDPRGVRANGLRAAWTPERAAGRRFVCIADAEAANAGAPTGLFAVSPQGVTRLDSTGLEAPLSNVEAAAVANRPLLAGRGRRREERVHAEIDGFLLTERRGKLAAWRRYQGAWSAMALRGIVAVIDTPSAFVAEGNTIWASTEDGMTPYVSVGGGSMRRASLANAPFDRPAQNCEPIRFRRLEKGMALRCRDGRGLSWPGLTGAAIAIDPATLTVWRAAASGLSLRSVSAAEAGGRVGMVAQLGDETATLAKGGWSFDALSRLAATPDRLATISSHGVWISPGPDLALADQRRPAELSTAEARRARDVAATVWEDGICYDAMPLGCPEWVGDIVGNAKEARRRFWISQANRRFHGWILASGYSSVRNRLRGGRFDADVALRPPVAVKRGDALLYSAPSRAAGVSVIGGPDGRSDATFRGVERSTETTPPRSWIAPSCFAPRPMKAAQRPSRQRCYAIGAGRRTEAQVGGEDYMSCFNEGSRQYLFRSGCEGEKAAHVTLDDRGDHLLYLKDGGVFRLNFKAFD